MKRISLIIALFWAGTAFGQHLLTYQTYVKGVAKQDTTTTQVIENTKCLKIRTEEKKLSNPIPGYAESNTYVDYIHDSIYTILDYSDGKYYTSYPMTNKSIVYSEEGKEKLLG